LLLETIENVRGQDYRPLEMVIVSDGPDPELRALVAARQSKDVPIVFAECGQHWSGVLTNSRAAVPFMVAQLLARGFYQLWWADDERALVPDHVSRLVAAIEDYDLDFAYPQVECYRPDRPDHKIVIGSNPPRNGTITHCLYRMDALDKGGLFQTHVGSGSDWDAVSRMMASGCKWGMVHDVTFSHQIDQ
jgi:hypothetical protein